MEGGSDSYSSGVTMFVLDLERGPDSGGRMGSSSRVFGRERFGVGVDSDARRWKERRPPA